MPSKGSPQPISLFQFTSIGPAELRARDASVCCTYRGAPCEDLVSGQKLLFRSAYHSPPLLRGFEQIRRKNCLETSLYSPNTSRPPIFKFQNRALKRPGVSPLAQKLAPVNRCHLTPGFAIILKPEEGFLNSNAPIVFTQQIIAIHSLRFGRILGTFLLPLLAITRMPQFLPSCNSVSSQFWIFHAFIDFFIVNILLRALLFH